MLYIIMQVCENKEKIAHNFEPRFLAVGVSSSDAGKMNGSGFGQRST